MKFAAIGTARMTIESGSLITTNLMGFGALTAAKMVTNRPLIHSKNTNDLKPMGYKKESITILTITKVLHLMQELFHLRAI